MQPRGVCRLCASARFDVAGSKPWSSSPPGVLGCSLLLSARALYSAGDDVIELTASNFNREVIQSDSLWLVEFYAPW